MPEVKDASEAVEIAKNFMAKTGWELSLITDVVLEGGTWTVRALTLYGQMTLKIDSKTGEVLEFRGDREFWRRLTT